MIINRDIHEPLPKPDFSDAERFSNKIANYVFDNFFPQHRKKFEVNKPKYYEALILYY